MTAWLRRFRFLQAYRALRQIAEDHRAQDHEVTFLALNEGKIVLVCHTCQDAALGRALDARKADPRECGLFGCGDERCKDFCQGVGL